jgi:2,4-dienoyl-CoA reductase-like NADH-dependent reductase (Old Yellow Enzyme family)/thioredoxin reductase
VGRLRFSKLFEPGRIGGMEVKNRIVMSPMVDNLGTEDGYVTERCIAYYEERARGGAGLIIVGASTIDFPRGKGLARNLAVDDDRYLSGLSRLAQAIKDGGAKAAIQIHHAGGEARTAITHMQPVAPSAIRMPHTILDVPYETDMPHALTISEIRELVHQFAEAVERCKRAGFDGVEVHADSGYLINQFLSPAFNLRRDEYGGELENRARFLIEIIKAAKEEAGTDFPIWCRLTVREYGVEGIKHQHAQEVAKLAERAGADAINTNFFVYGTYLSSPPPTAEPRGTLIRFAESIKQAVGVPVIAVGRIDPEIGEEVLQQGKADFVAIGRGLIADPDLPKKASEGRVEDIVPCITCSYCLYHIMHKGEELHCSVNPRVGREREYRLEKTGQKKRVMVVGGGLAGMEVARVAALRGHDVTLYEKGNQLGGQLLLAIIPPHKENMRPFIDYLRAQVNKLGIRVELGKEATLQTLKEVKPDVVVLATGASPSIPPIPGLDRLKPMTFTDVLGGKTQVGHSVVIIGGGMVGCELAEFLADQGKMVTILEILDEVAIEMWYGLGAFMTARLLDKGVTILTGIQYKQCTDEALNILTKEGKQLAIEADSVVVATGVDPNIELLIRLKGEVPEVHLVGDCAKPGRIPEAVDSAHLVGVLL